MGEESETMKSYEERDFELSRKDSSSGVWAFTAFLIIVALVLFCIHLMNRHNRLYEQYQACTEAVQLFSDWKEAQ